MTDDGFHGRRYRLVPRTQPWRRVEAVGNHASHDAFHRSATMDRERRAATQQLVEEYAKGMLALSWPAWLERLPEGHQKVVQLRIDGYEVAELALLVRRSQRG